MMFEIAIICITATFAMFGTYWFMEQRDIRYQLLDRKISISRQIDQIEMELNKKEELYASSSSHSPAVDSTAGVGA